MMAKDEFFSRLPEKIYDPDNGVNVQAVRSMLENIHSGIVLVDKNMIILYFNKAAENLLGRKADDIIGRHFSTELFPEAHGTVFAKKYMECVKENKGVRFEAWFDKPPYENCYDVHIIPFERGVSIFFDVITERKKAEERLAHINAVLKAVRNVNQLITHEKDAKKLIDKVCRELVQTRGYFNAWIVLTDDDGKITASASRGLGKSFEALIKEDKMPRCFQEAVKRGGDVVCIEDPLKDCPECHLSGRYKGRGGFAKKLSHNSRQYGFLAVSIPKIFVSDSEEQDLFRELSDDLAFALHSIESDKKLKERETFLENILQTTADGFWVVDSYGCVREVNDAYCRMSGYSRGELIGKRINDIDLIESPAETAARIERIKKRGSEVFETQHIKKDGGPLDIEISVTFMKEKGGRFICFGRDLTERKQLENKNQSLLNIIKNSQDFIGVVGKGENALFVNPAGQAMAGLDGDDVVSRTTIDEYFLEEDLPYVKETILPALYSEGRWSGEFRFRHFKTGEAIPVLYDLFLTEDPETGQLDNITTISRDITGRKQAEEAREEALAHALTREKEMRGLLSAAHKVIEEDNFEITARHIFDACCELTGAQSGYVALLSLSGEENELLFLEAGGLPCSVDPELPMPVRGLRAEAYKTGKVVYDNDFMNSPWIQYMPEGHCALGNVLFAPLVVEGKTLGIMGIANKPGGFTEDDAALAGAFGEMAAMAMKNAKSEEALQDSYRQYASLFNKMLSAFALHEMIYDSEGSPADYRFLDVNPAFEKLTGLKRKDILEKTVLEVLPDTEAFWIQHYGEVVKTGKPFAFESYSHALDKHFFVTAFRPEENQFAVLFLDITDRKQAETEIETQKLRLQNIIQGTDAGTWEWNVQTGETVFNDKWAEMIGYTLAELAPVSIKTWQKLTHPGDLKKCEMLLKNHFSGESEIYETEMRMKHRDGRWIWVLDRGKVMQRTSNGDPLWMFGTHQDVTERRQARDVIIREKAKAQRYLDIAGVMFVAMDENGIITLANKKAAEILECPEKEIEGENWFDTFIPEKEAEKVRKIFREMMSGRVIPHEYVENYVRAKSGQLKLIAWHNTALETKEGQIIGTISSGEDITARKEAERNLEEKIHELGRFNKLMTGRELKMIELKEEINQLMEKLGLPPKYRGGK